MHFPGVPILGQTAQTIPAQMRLDASEVVGKAIANFKDLGLRFGRIGVPTPPDSVSAQYVLTLESLEAAGCHIVAINEHPVGGHGGQMMLMACVVFRLPEALFTGVQA